MNDESWKLLAHFLITIIAMLPAVIAAISSLKNGRTLKAQNGTGTAVPSVSQPPSSSSNSVPAVADAEKDWYSPPDL